MPIVKTAFLAEREDRTELNRALACDYEKQCTIHQTTDLRL
jgi:hypothetical protein